MTQARRNAILTTNGVAPGQQHALWLGQEPEGACALARPRLFSFSVLEASSLLVSASQAATHCLLVICGEMMSQSKAGICVALDSPPVPRRRR